MLRSDIINTSGNRNKILSEDNMWSVVEKEISVENFKGKSYGISGATVVINDISTRKEEVEKFAEKLNRLDASEAHALELVEDFIER